MAIPNRIYKTVGILREVAIAIPNPVKNYRLAAAIVDKHSIISFGVNSYKTSPFQLKYGRNEHSIYNHAEVAAIKNALRYSTVNELKYFDIVVVRLKKVYTSDDVLVNGLAKPCTGCISCINAFGLRKIYYTTDSDYIEEMDVLK